MSSFIKALASLSMLATTAQSQIFKFCPETGCNNCPVAPGQAVGFPECNVYDTRTVLGDNGFKNADSGGFEVWVDVAPQDPGCSAIVRSPAGNDIENCGVPIGAWKGATCSKVILRETFMIQFCCGVGHCSQAGAGKRIRGIGPMGTEGLAMSGGGSMKFYRPDGTEVPTVWSGQPPSKDELAKRSAEKSLLQKRDCDNWRAFGSDYTKTASESRTVSNNVQTGTGGGQISVSQERSTSWTASFEIGFADVVSLGMSFSVEETTSSSETVTVDIGPGQSGRLVFTATHRCQRTERTCDGERQEGEVCSGYRIGNDVAGTYSVVATRL